MERRLAAILLTDMVGYSRLMGLDEEGTIARQKAHREEIFYPKIAAHGGRIVKTTGDGLLVEFASVVDAVKCAFEVQVEITGRDTDVPEDRRIEYRIGINLGDIVVDGDDILGDGVNVAARLEDLAKPGGICISGTVYDHLAGKLDVVFEDAGEQTVKNVPRPVRVWHWQPDGAVHRSNDVGASLPLPNKPSIAVLPFDNMSGDPEQEFFGDGIAEDVITALSRFRSLFVIARSSSFTYKGGAVDITQMARELGVRYVVEGSVRKAGNRVRITAQLIDAISGNHLWADRFDGSLDDVFDLQDQITEQIVVAVEPEIQTRERERARRKPPESLDAWELLQRGLSHLYRINETDRAEAIRLFREAIALDPEFAAAHAGLAYALWAPRSLALAYVEDTAKAIASARAAAERAVSLDPSEPMAHFALGRLHIFTGETEMAIAEMRTAIAINPNFAWGHYGLGWAYWYSAGQAEQALPHLDAALRLSPRDPWRFLALMVKGSALRFLGRHDEAITHCRQSCQFSDAGFLPYTHLATALAEAGQESEAQATIKKAMQLQPVLSVSFLRSHRANEHEISSKSLLDSLQKAGLPE
jgi:adenylate cyclase